VIRHLHSAAEKKCAALQQAPASADYHKRVWNRVLPFFAQLRAAPPGSSCTASTTVPGQT
jgi:hypothetical protein